MSEIHSLLWQTEAKGSTNIIYVRLSRGN